MIFIIQTFQLSGCLIQSLEGDVYDVLGALLLSLCSNRGAVAFTKGFSTSSSAGDPDVLTTSCWINTEDVSFLSEVVMMINWSGGKRRRIYLMWL